MDDRERKLETAILDIDAHATPLGEDKDGFVTGGYLVTVGALHRALGIIGHPSPSCRVCDPSAHDHQGCLHCGELVALCERCRTHRNGESCPACGTKAITGLGGWDSHVCQWCGGTGRPSAALETEHGDD